MMHSQKNIKLCYLLYAFFWILPTFRNTLSVPSSWAGRYEEIRLCGEETARHLRLFQKLIILRTYLPMRMEQTECSETSAYKIQTPGNYPKESREHSEQGESLKSIILLFVWESLKSTQISINRVGTLRRVVYLVASLLWKDVEVLVMWFSFVTSNRRQNVRKQILDRNVGKRIQDGGLKNWIKLSRSTSSHAVAISN